MTDLDEIATMLDDCARSPKFASQLDGSLSLLDAYAIQRLVIQKRLDRGETRIGMKMGFTSRAKMEQMGVDDMIWSPLTDAMLHEEGGKIDSRKFLQPRAEPEVAYLLKKPLVGKVSALEAQAAIEAVAPAIEILDSRFKDFKFSLPAVVADNTSSAGLVIGAWHSPLTDVSNLGIVLSVNGRPAAFGSTAAILGNPVRSLIAAARMAGEAGEALPSGSIILAGAATAAIHIGSSQYIDVEIQKLGRAAFHLI